MRRVTGGSSGNYDPERTWQQSFNNPLTVRGHRDAYAADYRFITCADANGAGASMSMASAVRLVQFCTGINLEEEPAPVRLAERGW